jgi:hypothetical protein
VSLSPPYQPSESGQMHPMPASIVIPRRSECSLTFARCAGSRLSYSWRPQEGAVQDGQTRRVPCHDDATVERSTRSLSPIRNHSTKRCLPI